MTDPRITKALERLEFGTTIFRHGGDAVGLTQPLAALIRDVSKPFYSGGVAWCRSCGCRNDTHANDDTDVCALIALCAAISGESPTTT